MSIHLPRAVALRPVVLSCDMPSCPIQLEPPPTEAWRNDTDARSWAREHAAGWTADPMRQTDYCPEHARFSTAPAAGHSAPRPTAAVRGGSGNPLDRDEYTRSLRERLLDGDRSAGRPGGRGR